MISGIFYVLEGVGFPAIRVKELGTGVVLVYVFTDAGPQMREAQLADSGTAQGTFLED